MENGVLDFLSQKDNYYLVNNKDIEIKDVSELLEKDLILYHIEEITFNEKAARKEAVENVLSSMKIEGINFLYLVLGDNDGVHFYFGIARDLYYDKEMTLGIEEIGNYILKPNINGNLTESKISELASDGKKEIRETINDMDYLSALEGVPGTNGGDGKYIDTLVNVMKGDKFGYVIISNPLNVNDIWNIEDNLSKLYTLISSLAINNVQESVSKSSTYSIANSAGESFTNVLSGSLNIQGSISNNKGGNTDANVSETNGKSEAAQNNNKDNQSNKSVTISNSNQEGTSIGQNWGKTIGKTISITGGYAKSNTTDSSITQVNASTEGTTTSTTVQSVNKTAKDWITYMDDVLFPRVDYGKGKGMFNVATFLFASEKAVLKRLEGITKLMFAGESGNKIPIKASTLNKDSAKADAYRKFQLPHGNFAKEKGINNPLARSAMSQYLDDIGTVTLGNLVSTNELSSAITFPQKEIQGLAFSKPRQFVVNIPDNIKEDEINYLIKIIEKLL